MCIHQIQFFIIFYNSPVSFKISSVFVTNLFPDHVTCRLLSRSSKNKTEQPKQALMPIKGKFVLLQKIVHKQTYLV